MARTRLLFALIPTIYFCGCLRYEPLPLTSSAVDEAIAPPKIEMLQSRADQLRHPMLAPVLIDLQHGLTPDSAAVFAVIVNPLLRAQRDRHALSASQLLQAGLLPNPTLDLTVEPIIGGNTQGTMTAYSAGVSWEFTALLTHDAKVAAARAAGQSVQLDVAWQEWQFAEAAKKAVYDLLSLHAQLEETRAVDQRLAENAALIRRAVDARQRTVLDLAAADAASDKAHADWLSIQRDYRHGQLALNEALGLPPDANINLAPLSALPSHLVLPPDEELFSEIEKRRLDLLALRMGYESQEQTLRAAVLAQFPKIVLGFHPASDNTNVHSLVFGVSIDLPIFDRNQGNIAIQKATRRQLFDEYASRIFEARSSIAQSLADIRSLIEQIDAAEKAVPALEQLVKTYQLAVGEHNVDVLSYYAAQNDLAQKRIDLLKLRQQLMDNKIALEIAAGRYLPEPQSGGSTRPANVEAH